METAVDYCLAVMKGGKISGTGKKKQYCYFTIFKNNIGVSAFKNKNSDRLVVHKLGG